jgi:hypothetical protein
MVTLKVGPSMTGNLAELGWLPKSDRVDKNIIAHALAGLIDEALRVRVVSSTAIEEGRAAPLRVTARPVIIGLEQSGELSPKLKTACERSDPRDLGLGPIQPSEILSEADALADPPQDNPPEAQHWLDTSGIAVKHAELSRPELSEVRPSAHPPQPSDEYAAWLWDRRLSLWQRWRRWAPEWGPRPDQDGCLAPDYLL